MVREKIAGETSRLQGLEQQREQQVASLNTSQAERAQAVKAISQQIKKQGGELQRLQSQAKSVETLLAKLRKAIEKSAAAKPKTDQ